MIIDIELDQSGSIPSDMEQEWLTLAQNIQRLMAEQGVTQVGLSRATGHFVSQSAISRILDGRPANTDVVEAIATALKTPLWRLFAEPDSIAVQLYEAYMTADPGGRDLIQKILERERTLSNKPK